MSSIKKYFILGAPGVGKTTFSQLLHTKLNIPLVEGDYLREILAQKEKTEEQDPFVYVGTKEAFRKFGDLTEENVIKGLHAVRKSMESYVEKEISLHDKIVLEAAFLEPSHVIKYGKVILVTCSDEEKHKLQFFEHRNKTFFNEEGFKAARILQQYLIKEARKYNLLIIENDGDLQSKLEFLI